MQIGIGLSISNPSSKGSGVVVAPSTFDPANKSSAVTLSEANARMTSDTTDRGAKGARSNSTGKRYFEVQIVSADPSGGIGLALVAETVDTWVGATANSIGIDTGNRQVYWANVVAGTPNLDPMVQNDVVGVYVDYTAGKMWFTRNGALGVNQSPVQPNGGFDIPAGAFFIMVSANAGNSFRLRTTAGQFTGAVLSGYTPWDA